MALFVREPQSPNTTLPPIPTNPLFVGLSHCVQSTSVLEPLDLRGVESVRELDVEIRISVGWVDSHGQRLADSKFSLHQVDLNTIN